MNTDSAAVENLEGDALIEDFKSIEADLVTQNNLYQRLAADFDKYQKHATEEIKRRAEVQAERLIRDLLPIVDHLEHAWSCTSPNSPDQLRESVRTTLERLYHVLRREGIEAEESIGRRFDPGRHVAVARRYDRGLPDHIVVEVYERGYTRGGEVFRAAKVVVNDPDQGDELAIAATT